MNKNDIKNKINELKDYKEKIIEKKKSYRSILVDKVLFPITFTIGALLFPTSLGLFFLNVLKDVPILLIIMGLGTALAVYSSSAISDVKKEINEYYKGYSFKKANNKIKEIDQEIKQLKKMSYDKTYKGQNIEEKNSISNDKSDLKSRKYEDKEEIKKADKKIKNNKKSIKPRNHIENEAQI